VNLGDGDHAAQLARMQQAFGRLVPHNRALGLRFVDFADGTATLALPYDARLVGDPERGILHGGAVTSLIDATCGAAVFLRLPEAVPIATLDLRIDYLRPATPGRDVLARADCYRLTRHVAFVRAVAYHDRADDPIASAAGSFMVSTPGRSVMQRLADDERAPDGSGD